MKKQTVVNKWIHKLFNCHSFWESIWNTILKSKPFYRCPECNRAMHCYWDGNDTNRGINYCDKCASKQVNYE